MTVILLFLLSAIAFAQTPPAWVARSNQNAQLLIDIDARYSPESAGNSGVAGMDERVSAIAADMPERLRADLKAAIGELQSRLASEKDPLVRQDLQILIDSADRDVRQSEINERHMLPYIDTAALVYSGISTLLQDQVSEARRSAALVRLRKYAGLDPGSTPITLQAEERFRAKLATPGLVGPPKVEVEKDLAKTDTYITGIGLLLEKYNLKDYQAAFAKLKEQLTAYDDFVRKEVLPKARTDFRMPPDVYKLVAREQLGLDYTPEDLAALGASKLHADSGRDAEAGDQDRAGTSSAFFRIIATCPHPEERSTCGRSDHAALSADAGRYRERSCARSI